jgi:UDP-glucose 4-epimerase
MAALSSDASVDEIVGVARRQPDITLPKVSWHVADVTRDPLDVVAGADAVVHLAWKIQPQHHHRELASTNVAGTRRVIEAVLEHEVPSLVVASSVGAYGPGPKDRPVDESWPTTGIPTSVYSRHKAAVESLLDAVEADNPQLDIARMRTSLVFQRRAASEIHRVFLGRLAPWHLPEMLRLVPLPAAMIFQATHADDIADAYRRAVTQRARGAFNVAAGPVLTPRLLASTVQGRLLPTPAAVLRAAADITFRLRLQPSEAGWIDMALQTPVMDTSRVRAELGWHETRSSIEAVQELVTGIGDGSGADTQPLHARATAT